MLDSAKIGLAYSLTCAFSGYQSNRFLCMYHVKPYAKWKNLVQLLPYIPPIYHKFYQTMAHIESEQKKIEAKGHRPNEKEEKDSK